MAFAQITSIPNASTTGVLVGYGSIKSVNRQVVRTVGNVVYIAAVDDSPCLASSSPTSAVIRMYKGSGFQVRNPVFLLHSLRRMQGDHRRDGVRFDACMMRRYAT